MHIVWFKRDLRVEDHAALAKAAERGPVLPVYIIEPELWAQKDASLRQWQFVQDSLRELHADLAQLGQPLVVMFGDAVQCLSELTATYPVTDIWSHEETGNMWSFDRDKRVAQWCKDNGIAWHEIQNTGVVRRLSSRNGWAGQWDHFMAQPVTSAPRLTPINTTFELPDFSSRISLTNDGCRDRQQGGRQQGIETLHSFLNRRGRTYRSAMSSPLLGQATCSRISPHLTWGTMSMREVAQATWRAQTEPRTPQWRGALKAFNARLHWHCHFMQKLEDEPRLEFENMHPAYNGLRPLDPDAIRLQAWENGETGLPFVDACMRSLRATGWLNFRMRAMVMAVASYHLWLDWRATGQVLARYFTDYEPGIHWSQVQMQSGTTGINTIRIYNPIKQGHDQDPKGIFTRRWLPELSAISDPYLQEPWKAENAGQVLGKLYPHPIVDPIEAARTAKERIWSVRSTYGFQADKAKVLAKHASRKKTPKRRAAKTSPDQLSLPL